jgi:hypothetical protein
MEWHLLDRVACVNSIPLQINMPCSEAARDLAASITVNDPVDLQAVRA